MIQISHRLQIFVRRFLLGTVLLDFTPQLLDDLGLLGDFVEEPGEGHGCGVSSCEEHGYELIAEDLSVTSVACQSVEERIAFVGFGFLLEFGLGECEGFVDVLACEFVQDLKNGQFERLVGGNVSNIQRELFGIPL